MYTTLSTLLLLASTAFAAPHHPANTTGGLPFLPGIAIPDQCRQVSDWEFISCPAKLRSGNALLTARNIVVNSLSGASKKSSNVLSVGWLFSSTEMRTYEESTLSIFEFPSGHEDKQCRFQFITDGDTDGGDMVQPSVRIYNVWKLHPFSGVLGEESTYWNKPERDFVEATFTTTIKDESYVTENGKHVHRFLFGPGEETVNNREPKTFKCPKGGNIAWEVASAVKTNGKMTGAGPVLNINGNAGLGIEILELKSDWTK